LLCRRSMSDDDIASGALACGQRVIIGLSRSEPGFRSNNSSDPSIKVARIVISRVNG